MTLEYRSEIRRGPRRFVNKVIRVAFLIDSDGYVVEITGQLKM